MHEFSICERIVEAVLAEFDRVDPRPVRLLRTRVVVGGLHQIMPDYLAFAYETLTCDTAAAGSELEVVTTPVVACCRACDWNGKLEPPIFRCGACGSPGVDLVGGKELYLEHLEVESEEPGPPP